MRVSALFLLIVFAICGIQRGPSLSEQWNSLADFPKVWTSLQRDSKGYLVYSPCNGTTPMMIISRDTLRIVWQNEVKIHLIKKFNKINNDQYTINCFGSFDGRNYIADEPDVKINVRIVDRKRKLILWRWISDYGTEINIVDSAKWVMTPEKYSNEFRKVNNPCKKGMKEEKHFLPVEFN